MATPNLPSTSSIIDYLNAKGQDSSYTARKKMYETSGVSSRLGSYTGASNQNLALLDYLKNQSTSGVSRQLFTGAPMNAFEAKRASESQNLKNLSISGARANAMGVNFGAFTPYLNLGSVGGATTPAFGKITPIPQNTPTANKPATLSAYKPGAYTNVPTYTASDGTRFTTSSDISKYGQPNEETKAILGTKSGGQTPTGQTPAGQTPATDILKNIDTSYMSLGSPNYTYGLGALGTQRETGGRSAETTGVTGEATGTPAETPTGTPAGAPAGTPTGAPTPNLDTLRSVIAQGEAALKAAKAKGLDTTAIEAELDRAKKMLAQGGVEGDKPFKGSVYDTPMGSQYEPTNNETKDEADLINQFLNSSEGKLLQERMAKDGLDARSKAETAKAELETKYKSDKETLENKLAESGLAFSGIRATQVKSLSDALASSVLKTDRELASALVDADIDFRSKILDGVAELLKQAQNDEDDAIKQLNLMGYALYGGQLYPTLAAKNAEADDIRANANLAIAQRRLEIAEDANARAARKAAKDESHEDDLLNFILDLQDPENEDATDAERIAYGMLYYPNLDKDEIEAGVNIAPTSASNLTSWATDLVKDQYAETWGNFDATDLQNAKDSAKRLARSAASSDAPIVFGENEQEIFFRNADDLASFLAIVDSVTLDEVK